MNEQQTQFAINNRLKLKEWMNVKAELKDLRIGRASSFISHDPSLEAVCTNWRIILSRADTQVIITGKSVTAWQSDLHPQIMCTVGAFFRCLWDV
jgi:hypothetical protein